MNIVKLLAGLKTLVVAKNGGEENDVSRLLEYAHAAVRAGDQGKRHVDAAVAKVEQLVREDRSLVRDEINDMKAALQGKLGKAAGLIDRIRDRVDAPPAPRNALEPPTEADVETAIRDEPAVTFPKF